MQTWKKKPLRSLLATAVLAALAGGAQADSGNVTIYGKVRGGVDFQNNDASYDGSDLTTRVSQTKVSNYSSRIGFKGTEDLGNGLSAIWQIENGVAIDDGSSGPATGTFGSRDTWVGLQGNWGTLKLGRETSPYDDTASRFDKFQVTTRLAAFLEQTNTKVGTSSSTVKDPIVVGDTRKNNAVLYTSPSVNGFDGSVQWYTNEDKSTTTNGRGYSLRGGYKGNGLGIDLAYENNQNGKTVSATQAGKETALVLSVGYDITPTLTAGVKLYRAKNDRASGATSSNGADKNSGYALFANYQASNAVALRAFYGRIKAERQNGIDDANDWTKKALGLGASYSLSKRTALFAEYYGEKTDRRAVTATSINLKKRIVSIGISHDF